jgi:class 3 adenylate cyclase
VLRVVISFAGDALLCIFSVGKNPSTTHVLDVDASESVDKIDKSPIIQSLEEACELALQCAYQMRQHTIHSLSAHFAVSCGLIQFATLGGVRDEWVYIMGGDCITDLSKYIDVALPKQVVCSQACAAYAQQSMKLKMELSEIAHGALLVKSLTVIGSCNATQEGNNATNLEAAELALSAQQPSRDLLLLDDVQLMNKFIAKANYFIPRPVQNSLYADSLSNIAELRRITVMFLKLDSFNTATCHHILSLQRFFVLLQEVLAYSGGFLRQFLIDDKGCVAIAMWGVPSYTHNNDCSRGLYCAWNVLTQAAGMDHHCSIGLTTGYAYCGIIGSSMRRDYVCMGDKVNIAARLMSKAKGRVLIDPDIYSFISYDERKNLVKGEPLMLKGMTETITPYLFTPQADLQSLQFYDEEKVQSIIRKDVVQKLLYVLDSVTLVLTGAGGDDEDGAVPFLSTLAVNNSNYKNSDLKSTILVGEGIGSETRTSPRQTLQALEAASNKKQKSTDKGSNEDSSSHKNTTNNSQSGESKSTSTSSSVTRLTSMFGLLSNKKTPSTWSGDGFGRSTSNGAESPDVLSTPNQTPLLSSSRIAAPLSSPKASIGGDGILSTFSAKKTIELPVASSSANATTVSGRRSLNSGSSDPADKPQVSARRSLNAGTDSAAGPPVTGQASGRISGRVSGRMNGSGANMKKDLVPLLDDHVKNCRVVVVAGLSGTGKSAAARFFRKSCHRRKLPCHLVNCRLDDQLFPFAVTAKLFWELAGGKEKYRSIAQKKACLVEHITAIRKDVFDETREQIIEFMAEILIEEVVLKRKMTVINAGGGIMSGRSSKASSVNGDDEDDEEMFGGFSRSASEGNFVPGFARNMSNDTIGTVGDRATGTTFESPGTAFPIESFMSQDSQVEYALDSFMSRDSQAEVSFESLKSLTDCNFTSDDVCNLIVDMMKRLLTNASGGGGIGGGPSTSGKYKTHTSQKNRHTCIIIEDAHYCDDLSWSVMNCMQNQDMDVVFLVTVTPPAAAGADPTSTNIEQSNFARTYSASANSPSLKDKEKRRLAGDENGDEDDDDQALVLGVGKDYQQSEAYNTMLRRQLTTVIELGALTESEVRDVLKQVQQGPTSGPGGSGKGSSAGGSVPAAAPSAAVVEQILAVTAGNAFWVRQVARYIRENSINDFMSMIGTNTALATLQKLILIQLERLGTEQQVVVKHASVIGEEFTIRLLAAVLPSSTIANLKQSILVAQDMGIIHAVEDRSLAIYRFHNALTRETICLVVPPSDASDIHLKAAKYIEKQFASNLRQYYAW